MTLQAVNEPRPRTWLAKFGLATDVVIAIPADNVSSSYPLQSAVSSFETDFEVMFDEKAAATDGGLTKASSSTKHALENYERPSRHQIPTALPSLDALTRPETLFDNLQPYYLIVKVLPKEMVVQASHQPSLELLAGYLRKYTRSMKNVTVKVRRTAFSSFPSFTIIIFANCLLYTLFVVKYRDR